MCRKYGIEIIVSDDSETSLIFDLVKKHPHIRYLNHNSTANAVDNWNFGLDHANGVFHWLLHHDEYLKDIDPIIEQLRKCEKHSIDLIILKLCMFRGSKLYSFKSRLIKDFFLIFPNLIYAFNVFGSPSVVIYRSSEVRYNNKMKWLVDVDFFVNLFKKYKKKKLTDIEIISSAVETESITDTIERHYDFHLNELQFVECHHLVKFLLRVLIF